MADDKPKGFWKRLKEIMAGGTPPLAPSTQADVPSPTDPGVAPKRESLVLSTSQLTTDNIGRVYAQALLELATQQGVVDELAEQVQSLMPTIAAGSELHRLLSNPAIRDEQRSQIIERVFAGKVHDLLYKMFRVLGDKGRLGSLPQVASGYLLAVAEAKGQVDVQAYVATELDAAAVDQVAQQIGQALGKTVSLTQHVDPALIGGMKIKIGDRLIDASVASQLRNMKNKMVAAGRG